jgi:spore germination protein KC
MYYKKLLRTILIVLLIFPLAGCWDSLDINEKDLTTTVVVDKIKDDYAFIVEIANLSPRSSSEERRQGETETFSVVSSKGRTFAKARLDLDRKLPKPIFLGTVRMLVLTKDMAEYGIAEYMFRLRNLYEYRKALNVVTTAQDAEEIIELQSGSTVSAGHTIEDILDKLNKTGKVIKSSASEILEKLSRKNVCFLLPNIDIVDDSIAFNGYSVIHNTAYNNFIPIEDTRGINYILNDKVKYIYVVPFEKNNATVEVKLKKKSIKPFFKNKKVSFKADFEFESIVKYMDINHGLDEKAQREIKQALARMIYDDISSAIKKSQKEIECDYLEFSEVFRIGFQNEYREMDWCKIHLDAFIDVKVTLLMDPGGQYDYNPEIN